METDYSKLGFKCGIEIHQQLEGKKLFCRCPAINSSKEPDRKSIRYLRAVAGETGEIDVAAKHEMQKGKYFIYESNSEDTCLVEYDEQPPYPINDGLIDAALEVSLLLNAKIVDEIQVMRKTVVDGSNTSGFQRTALIAYDGYIKTSLGRVNIPLICLEEEAAQKTDEAQEYTKYSLDRLGIGLIEIGTSADIKNPEHAKEVASILGMILRSTGKVKRGLGTIRQDVNVSIANGARTEIKGFQDLRSIPKVIEYEVRRQMRLISDGEKINEEVRKAEPDMTTSFLRPMPGAARLYPETDVPHVRITKERLAKIRLPELIDDKLKILEEKYAIAKDKLKSLMKEDIFGESRFILFEKIAKTSKEVKPAFICETLLSYASEILKKHRGSDPLKVKKEHILKIFEELDKGRINKNSVMDILVDISLGNGFDIKKYELQEIDLEGEVKALIKEKQGLSISGYMGLIMAKHRGKVDGKQVMVILKKFI